MTDCIMLKWGTVKGWELSKDEDIARLQKWADFGTSMSAMAQRDTPEQKEALIDFLRHFEGDFWNDWDTRKMTRDEAIQYVTEYGKPS